MKLFRILMTRYGKDGRWSYADHLPTFYVHACTGEDARARALIVTGTESSVTSGTAIAVDGYGDTIPTTYYSWTDV